MSGSPPDSPPGGAEPDLPRVAALLQQHGVDSILVGGMSAVLHGSTVRTKDIDTVPRWTRANLDRLCRALNSVGAEIMVRGSPDDDPAHETYLRLPGGLEFEDVRHLGSFRVRTATGDRIDILRSIPLEAGDHGHRASYDELAVDATIEQVAQNVRVRLVSRQHLIRSKAAIGRPHDLAVIRDLTNQLAARDLDPPPEPGLGL